MRSCTLHAFTPIPSDTPSLAASSPKLERPAQPIRGEIHFWFSRGCGWDGRLPRMPEPWEVSG